MTIDEAKNQLTDHDPEIRRNALDHLTEMKSQGIWVPQPVRPWMNLHAHTFHSFNANGWSPSRLVFEAVDQGLEIVGSVDFDVLNAMEEMFQAGDLLGIRTVVGLETRVFVPEYADRVLNSPGEPGIAYFMAAGCTHLPEDGSKEADTLASLKKIAQQRNRGMIERINDHLETVRLDYQADVVSLTPSGNPTERHLVEAYDHKARSIFSESPADLARYWAEKLGVSQEQAAQALADRIRFQELLRSKLMKQGGVGYVTPDPSSFPTLKEVVELGLALGGLPTYAFLDGTTAGERDIAGLLTFMKGQGVQGVNIIPDRNWNLPDPEEKALKLGKLRETVEAARRLNMPLCIGTEMNKAGQRFVDDFDAPELAPYVEDFRRGARVLWGHTFLSRCVGFGWNGDRSGRHFGDSAGERLKFFHRVGTRFGPDSTEEISVHRSDPDPTAILGE